MNLRLQQKIQANSIKDRNSDCWLWTGQITNSGYGRMMIKDDDNQIAWESAQQISYMAFIGPVPKGMLSRHVCGNRLCVNPEHLELFDPDAWRK
ncbi:MAG TPA: HNH endonuclease signature motif containing protein [Gammaproteobacteria bacterium]